MFDIGFTELLLVGLVALLVLGPGGRFSKGREKAAKCS